MPNPTPSRVPIVEVGPRDGLQNDPRTFSVEAKVAFIEALSGAGATVIETAAFVSPKAVPQMAGSDAVMRALDRRDGVRYLALVPNEKGYDRAREAGVDAVALFASATEAFPRRTCGRRSTSRSRASSRSRGGRRRKAPGCAVTSPSPSTARTPARPIPGRPSPSRRGCSTSAATRSRSLTPAAMLCRMRSTGCSMFCCP
jgi:hypothetical protein